MKDEPKNGSETLTFPPPPLPQAGKLLIVIGCKNRYYGNRWLVQEGADKLLAWLLRRLSIPLERRSLAYVFSGGSSALVPKRKRERQSFLAPHIETLAETVRQAQPCSVVAMGVLACEVLEGSSVLKKRAGTYWPAGARFQAAGLRNVWVTRLPEAALANPALCVEISRMLGHAALEARLTPKVDASLQMFDFLRYERFFESHPSGLGL